ncbi:MAG TPA: prolipoprotein diacylglyceryl transferase family protein [Candidatus Acidoferrales bacterium]|nr:prolipoprotein diacylglyceryl transferase family protein [Candidatus Acidoferrales bacterium]
MVPIIRLGPLTLGTYGLFVALGLLCALFVLRADLRRREIPADPHTIIGLTGLAGLAGSKLYHLLESPSEFLARPWSLLISQMGFAWFGGFLGGLVTLILLAKHYRISVLQMLDLASPSAALGYGVGRIGCLISGDGDYGIPTSLPWGMSFPYGLVPTIERVHPTPIYEFLVSLPIAYYLWRQGVKSLRGPRPMGEIFANYLILTGLARFLVEFIRINPRSFFGLTNAQVASLVSTILGGVLLAGLKQRFRSEKPTHRILQHTAKRGEVVQREYHRPTPECPHPEHWRMFDVQTAEVEVLQFLKGLVTTVKPKLVVETGTFLGTSTLWIAEGLKENGFGRVITCESDPVVYVRTKERIEASGLAGWIEYRNESSLNLCVQGTIDILFSDSDVPLREQEVRRFLPQVSPHGLILIHDASTHLRGVREAALRLEQEGLLSVVFLPTPRGLVVAQKREGRR